MGSIDVAGRLAKLESNELGGPLPAGSPVVDTVYSGTADAILFPYNQTSAVIAPATGTDACTLAAPNVGAQPLGDGGKTVEIINGVGTANSVTCPSAIIVDGSGTNKTTITFAAHNGGSIRLRAHQGLWYVLGTPLGVTYS
jgi:hypothetical protein